MLERNVHVTRANQFIGLFALIAEDLGMDADKEGEPVSLSGNKSKQEKCKRTTEEKMAKFKKGIPKNLTPVRIEAATDCFGPLMFVVQFAETEERNLALADDMKKLFPFLVIDFYEEHVKGNTLIEGNN